MAEERTYFTSGEQKEERPAAQQTAASAQQRPAQQRSTATGTQNRTASGQRRVSTQTITTPQRSAQNGQKTRTPQSQRTAAGASGSTAQKTAPRQTSTRKKSRFQKTNASNKNKRTVSSTAPEQATRTRRSTSSATSAQKRRTASTQQTAARTSQQQRQYKQRPVAPESVRARADQAARQSTATRAAYPANTGIENVSAGAAIEATSAAMKQSRARNKAATKGMSVKQKGAYYLAQIGPTVQEVKASPERKKMTYYILILLVALILAMHVTSLTNDVMGFMRSTDTVEVTVTEDMTTNELITALDKAGAIKHSTFCKAFIAFANKVDNGMFSSPTYLKGNYTVTPNMGIEKMLITCMNVQKQETVEVSIPEGFTVEQIAERLEDAKVCSEKDFLEACNTVDYDYDFLTEMSENEDELQLEERYHMLEGYLYPDTYEFFVGESASSVVSKLLSNTNTKWSDAYAERAEQINMTMDEVLTLASIIQKEDSNAENMAVIASIFYNRINSSSFPSLQSDATNYYVNTYIKPNVTTAEYETYRSLYSTYECRGLPVGPICSPGDDAIKAALWPESTNYYFFAHDDDGNLYTARTANEQNLNVYNALSSDSSSDEE